MLPMDRIANGVKCEDLEKIFVNDDSKFFFSGRSSATSLGEGRADRVS